MYPLATGYVTLPRLKLNLPRYQSNDSQGKATIAAQILVKVEEINQHILYDIHHLKAVANLTLNLIHF